MTADPRRRRWSSVTTALAALGVVGLGCGAPTAQVVTTEESPFTFEIPVEFDELEGNGGELARYYGVAGSAVGPFGADPVLSLVAGSGGERESFQSLRSLSVGGRFDPIDAEDPERDENVQLINYMEIGEPDVWGVRLQLLVASSGVSDFQALVDRRSDQIVITEMRCTQACFAEQVDVIDQIQRSWSREP